jgi:GDP-4-dehydro-6-deoxy-D-mannose reductase
MGRHLLHALKTSFPGADILAERFDVTDRDAVLRAVCDARPDACIHLAGIASVVVANLDPDQVWRVNLYGALNVAEALLALAPNCQLIFASSAEILRRIVPGWLAARRNCLVSADERLRGKQSRG